LEENPEGFLNIIWTNPETNLDVIKLSQNNNNIYCSVWIHPCDIYDLDLEKAILSLENNILENKDKIVAIWECWLDYYWLKPENDKSIAKYDKETQEKVIIEKKKLQELFFKAQILLAKKYKLPVIIIIEKAKMIF
jgi:Tat protein secretion system quality control protein TatD with DNase activity